MNKEMQTNLRTPLIKLVMFIGIAAMIFGCGADDKKAQKKTVEASNLSAQGDAKESRELAPSELDTLRAMKVRLDVVRDEYFGKRGGVLGTDWCDVWYPEGKLTVTHGMYTLDQLWKARRRVNGMFGSMPTDKLQIVCSVSMTVYNNDVKRQWWQYSRIEDNQITFQPIPVLFKRGLIDIAIAHEYFKWAVRELSKNEVPRWLEEGIAAVMSKEEPILVDQMEEFPDREPKMAMADIEKALKNDNDKKQVRIASYNSFKMTEHLVTRFGKDKIAQFINEIGSGSSLDEASKASFGMPFGDMELAATEWKSGGDK